MTQVEFDSENAFAPRAVSSAEQKGIIGLVIRWGLAKDVRQANYVLIGVIIVATALAAAIYFL